MLQILACISAASYHFPVGAVVAFSAVLIPKLQEADSDIKVNLEETSWIGNCVLTGLTLSTQLCDSRFTFLELTFCYGSLYPEMSLLISTLAPNQEH